MIFLRQKQFNNSRNCHRNRSRTHNQRHLQHLQITRQNAVDLSHQNSHRSRRMFADSHNEQIIRSAALNEKLASIGGLIGAVNIIITAALLYSIFTAKPNERWWYISAVILNISLLIFLMLSAILFDRYYLKRCRSQHSSSSSLNNNRIINTTPELLPYPHNSQNFPINSSDVPPQYPGYMEESNSVKIEYETVPHSRLIISTDELINRNSLNSYEPVNNLNENKTDNSKLNGCIDEAGKYQLPPNYFDLYPSEQKANNLTSSIPSTSSTSTMTTSSTESSKNDKSNEHRL